MNIRGVIALLGAVAFLGGAVHTETQLVNLNVVAVDSHGQPITDLTSDDLQITDAGKRQQIAFFRHDDGKSSGTPSLGPGEFSNRGSGASPHATLVLFDLLNERFTTRALTANQIVRDLAGIENADNLYLSMLTLDGRLFAVHGITGAWSENPETGNGPWTRQIKTLMDNALHTVLQPRPVDIDVTGRVILTFNALQSVAAQLSGFPGRKNIVWVTDGIPIGLGPNSSDTGEFVDFTPQLRQLAEWFERSGVSIYPVRQVMIGSPNAMGAENGATGAGSIDTLDQLAGLTGGRPTGTKDVGAAVRQAMSDIHNSYQVGYYPSPRNWDGKFHTLRVTTTRKNVHIQTRSGYFAMAEEPGARATRAIAAASQTGLDAGEIGLRVMSAPDPANNRHVRLVIRVDANNIALPESGGQYSAGLRIAMIEYRPVGAPITMALAPIDLHYTREQLDGVLKTGIDFHQELTLEEGVGRVRCIVFDRGSNSIGSVTFPVGQAPLNGGVGTTGPR